MNMLDRKRIEMLIRAVTEMDAATLEKVTIFIAGINAGKTLTASKQAKDKLPEHNEDSR